MVFPRAVARCDFREEDLDLLADAEDGVGDPDVREAGRAVHFDAEGERGAFARRVRGRVGRGEVDEFRGPAGERPRVAIEDDPGRQPVDAVAHRAGRARRLGQGERRDFFAHGPDLVGHGGALDEARLAGFAVSHAEADPDRGGILLEMAVDLGVRHGDLVELRVLVGAGRRVAVEPQVGRVQFTEAYPRGRGRGPDRGPGDTVVVQPRAVAQRGLRDVDLEGLAGGQDPVGELGPAEAGFAVDVDFQISPCELTVAVIELQLGLIVARLLRRAGNRQAGPVGSGGRGGGDPKRDALNACEFDGRC